MTIKSINKSVGFDLNCPVVNHRGHAIMVGHEMSDEAVAFINGIRYKLPAGKAESTLLQFLRGEG